MISRENASLSAKCYQPGLCRLVDIVSHRLHLRDESAHDEVAALLIEPLTLAADAETSSKVSDR